MDFTYTQRRQNQSAAQRSVVMSTGGMVAASQPLAAAAGLRILRKGGNAVDAAVAMVAVLNVVDPYSVGIGGDAFALIHIAKEHHLVGMNGSGRSPYRATVDWFRQQGMKEIPAKGILGVSVPGALHGWAQALERFGTLSLSEVFEDAINYACEGFPVTEVVAGEWKHQEEVLRTGTVAARAYLVNGKAPRPGQRFRNPDLGRTLTTIAREGIGTFYEGPIADAIVECSQRLGGLLEAKDLADHTTTWVEPISIDYRGCTIFELPPNGQGLTALQMLNTLEGYDIAGLGPNSPQYLHLLIEAKKAAFVDRDTFIADPEFADLPVAGLLSKEYARVVRSKIDPQRANQPPARSALLRNSETVYLTAMDKDRNAVSFISSIFEHFGSGIVVDGTGIVLQNRGKAFSLDPRHFNCLEPHKRPFHTIIPAMLFKDGRFLMSFGVMGADMQPQGHVQFLTNLIDFRMNPQEAMDTPRARHMDGMEVYLEDGIPPETRSALEAKGHRLLGSASATNQVGAGQAIYFDAGEDVLLGASDRRKDGCAIGY